MCSSDDHARAELCNSHLFRMKDSQQWHRSHWPKTVFFTSKSPYASYPELLKIFLKHLDPVSHWSPYSLLPSNHSEAGRPELHKVCQAPTSTVRASYKDRNAPILWDWLFMPYICIYSNYLCQITSLKQKKTHFFLLGGLMYLCLHNYLPYYIQQLQ